MTNWEEVDKETFKKFLKDNPDLVYDFTSIREPPMESYNDFSDGKKWPESMMARAFRWNEPPSYQIKELADE